MVISVVDAEARIQELRKFLVDDEANFVAFKRRYRPDIERMQSSLIKHDDNALSVMRRLTLAGRVWELVELLNPEGATHCALIVDYQTQKVHQFSRYLEAEVTVVDLMQGDS